MKKRTDDVRTYRNTLRQQYLCEPRIDVRGLSTTGCGNVDNSQAPTASEFGGAFHRFSTIIHKIRYTGAVFEKNHTRTEG
jgi:hypothetical protein